MLHIESLTDAFVAHVRSIYGDGFVPLHRPVFEGKERDYLVECIDSNFVSSVGQRVTDFEQSMAAFVGVAHGVATVNGTAALHIALQLAGVGRGDEVLSQALTFVATCNALSYTGARPVFVDVDRDTLGMSPAALLRWLEAHAERRDGQCYNRGTGARLAACVPMHSFGLPCRVEEIAEICKAYGIPLVEDAAESLGSYVGQRHTGSFGHSATLSFNGNKIITTGGGGMIVSNDAELARRAKHLTTTAKVPHAWEFVHDEIGYNYRMPNVNAALGCAQLEQLPAMLKIKAELASGYVAFFDKHGVQVAQPLPGTRANHWLTAVILPSREARDAFLKASNAAGVMTRPVWQLMHRLPMFQDCQHDGLRESIWLEERVVNVPSSVPASRFGELS